MLRTTRAAEAPPSRRGLGTTERDGSMGKDDQPQAARGDRHERETDDPQEFTALALAHARAVHGVATALVGALDAEDVAQEAILRAWDAWPRLRDRGAFRSWLLRITVNVCHNWQRGYNGLAARCTEPFPEGDALVRALAASGPGGNDHVAAMDLRRAINALDEEHRSIVFLRYYVGMDASEIGAILEAPAATIRTRLRRALALLHAALLPSGNYPTPRHRA